MWERWRRCCRASRSRCCRDRLHQHRTDAPRPRRPARPGAAGGRAPDRRPRPPRARLAERTRGGADLLLGLPLAPADWSGLSLAVGVSVAESAASRRIRLKWPNDLWVNDRKLGGILIETATAPRRRRARYAIVGVGMNINIARPAEGLSTPPAGLQELLPRRRRPGEALLRDRAGRWCATCSPSRRRASRRSADRFQARDVLRGRPVAAERRHRRRRQGVRGSGACWCILPRACRPSPAPR
jgi:hypothetical protein